MTPLEITICVSAVCASGGAVAYTWHAVRTHVFEQPTEAQIKHMLDTAPRGRFDAALARGQRCAEADL